MANERGWAQDLMISFFKKAAIDGAVTVNNTNFCGLVSHENFDPEYDDVVISDLEEVSGSEIATSQEIQSKGVKFTITMNRARPNFIIGSMLMCMGSHATVQDGAATAYTHTGALIAPGTALPYVNVIGKKGGIQRLMKGIICNSVEISSAEKGAIKCVAEFIGSGHRATNADSFIDPISEARLLAGNLHPKLESGANISISASLTQAAENISSATPDDISTRLMDWRFKMNNNCVVEFGHGSGDVAAAIDFMRRTYELDLSLRWYDSTELGYYEDQTAVAFEADCYGSTKIDGAGTLYPGFKLVVPKFQLVNAAMPQGGVNDKLQVKYKTLIMDDGTNPFIKFAGYNARSTYLAA